MWHLQRDKNTKMHIKTKVVTFSCFLDTFHCICWFLFSVDDDDDLCQWLCFHNATSTHTVNHWVCYLEVPFHPPPNTCKCHNIIPFLCTSLVSVRMYYHDKWISYLILFYFVLYWVDIVSTQHHRANPLVST